MNPPARSKINWTALGIQIIGALCILNVLPAELEDPLSEITLILGPTLIQVLRTYFTEPKP